MKDPPPVLRTELKKPEMKNPPKEELITQKKEETPVMESGSLTNNNPPSTDIEPTKIIEK